MLQNKLLIGFALFSAVALIAALLPLRRYKKSMLLLVPMLLIAVSLSYWRWGGWALLQQYEHTLEKQQHVQAMLDTVKNPQQLIDRLKTHIQRHPNSARGWYLLGRLYSSQNQWTEAESAFNKAHQLKPQDTLITVNWAQSLFTIQQGEQARALLLTILQSSPNQPDALAILALDAYKQQKYQQAIDYWERLLVLMPSQSEEAQAIRKAIAKAEADLR